MASPACGLMHSYHNVAELRQIRGVFCGQLAAIPSPQREVKTEGKSGRLSTDLIPSPPLAAAAINLDIEVPDLLSQGIAIEAQEVRGTDLIAAGGRKRSRQERHLDLLQNPVIEAGRGHAVGETREVRRQIGFD